MRRAFVTGSVPGGRPGGAGRAGRAVPRALAVPLAALALAPSYARAGEGEREDIGEALVRAGQAPGFVSRARM